MRPGEKLQRDGVSQPANEKTCFYFIPSSESSAYLKQIKCILSAVKKYRIFSLVTDTIFIFSL